MIVSRILSNAGQIIYENSGVIHLLPAYAVEMIGIFDVRLRSDWNKTRLHSPFEIRSALWNIRQN